MEKGGAEWHFSEGLADFMVAPAEAALLVITMAGAEAGGGLL